MNPYRVVLLVLSLLSLATGLILLGVGSSLAADYFAGPTAGLTQLAVGGTFITLGAVAFIVWLAVSAIAWKPGPPSGVTLGSLASDFQKGLSER